MPAPGAGPPSNGSFSRLLQTKNKDFYKWEVGPGGQHRGGVGGPQPRPGLTGPMSQTEYCRKALGRTRVKSSVCLEG